MKRQLISGVVVAGTLGGLGWIIWQNTTHELKAIPDVYRGKWVILTGSLREDGPRRLEIGDRWVRFDNSGYPNIHRIWRRGPRHENMTINLQFEERQNEGLVITYPSGEPPLLKITEGLWVQDEEQSSAGPSLDFGLVSYWQRP